MKQITYFAYGSNLDLAQMRRRCPSAVPASKATLHGYQLAFAGHSPTWGGGVATVTPKRHAKVEGMVYVLSEEDLVSLDRFEGAPHVYEREIRVVVDEASKKRRVNVYRIAGDCVQPARPGARYFGTILRAYQRLGFNRAPLADAATVAARDGVDRAKHGPPIALVLVYGTRLAGEPNHRVIEGSTFVGPARTEPRFRMVTLGPYPAIVPDGSTTIHGEIYEVDGKTLARLDALEGHPDFYTRTPIVLDDGKEVLAYLMRATQVRGRKEIPSGDWRQHRKETA